LKAGVDDATVVVSNSARGSHYSIVGCADSPARQNERVLMAVRNLTERVEVLEMKVGSLEELPARMSAVESQIVQLRNEMRGEFSAVRQEMRALNEETRSEMRMLHEEVLDRIAKIGEGRRAPKRRR
jgi:vacuolar-type H+-ATPase subunit H